MVRHAYSNNSSSKKPARVGLTKVFHGEAEVRVEGSGWAIYLTADEARQLATDLAEVARAIHERRTP